MTDQLRNESEFSCENRPTQYLWWSFTSLNKHCFENAALMAVCLARTTLPPSHITKVALALWRGNEHRKLVIRRVWRFFKIRFECVSFQSCIFKKLLYEKMFYSIHRWYFGSRMTIHVMSLLTTRYSILACLHDQSKSGFLEGRLFSSQSEFFENFSNYSDWLDKSRPSKNATFVLSCKQAIYQHKFKGWVQCFSMQVVMNKCFLL